MEKMFMWEVGITKWELGEGTEIRKVYVAPNLSTVLRKIAPVIEDKNCEVQFIVRSAEVSEIL